MRQNTYPETPTYTDRRSTATVTVTNVDEHGAITVDAGWTWGGHRSLEHVTQGTVLLVETQNVSMVVGVAVEDDPDMGSGVGWLFRKSDQTLRAEWGELRNDGDVRRRRMLRANRDAWQAREDALPEWLRERLRWFHLRGGEEFEAEGWGYELVICELAALYFADEDWVGLSLDGARNALGMSEAEEPEAVMAKAREEGTSGNQHGMAQSLALTHARHPERSFAGTVSALSPITGDPDYSHGQDYSSTADPDGEDDVIRADGYVQVHLQVTPEGDEVVLEHPLEWTTTADEDTVHAYGERVLDALSRAALLPPPQPGQNEGTL